MANCILLEKGTENVIYFIKECIKTASPTKTDAYDYAGSNASVTGLDSKIYDEIWTANELVQDITTNSISPVWIYDPLTIAPALVFKNEAVTTAEDVYKVIDKEVRKLYSEEDEIRVFRDRTVGYKVYLPDYEVNVDALLKEGDKFIKDNSLT